MDRNNQAFFPLFWYFLLTLYKGNSICSRLEQTKKSAVTEHALNEGDHKILFGKVKLFATSWGYYSRLVLEAIKLQKYTDNFNKKEEPLKKRKLFLVFFTIHFHVTN